MIYFKKRWPSFLWCKLLLWNTTNLVQRDRFLKGRNWNELASFSLLKFQTGWIHLIRSFAFYLFFKQLILGLSNGKQSWNWIAHDITLFVRQTKPRKWFWILDPKQNLAYAACNSTLKKCKLWWNPDQRYQCFKKKGRLWVWADI